MENIRTMELIGVDFWSRPVYKCIETERLYKDITLGSDNPELYSCGNDFEGEPNCAIESHIKIHFKDKVKQQNREDKFRYQLLSRLKSDCDYYLGFGGRSARNLWAKTEREHIDKMKELHNTFSESDKPEWLTYDNILEYEMLMIQS